MNARVREAVFFVLILLVLTLLPSAAQELGGAGTVQGTITDPTGGVMQAVDVKLSNPVSGLARTATTDAAGKFIFRNLPPNPYHLTVEAQGFKGVERDIDVRSAVPIDINVKLEVGVAEAVSVIGHAEDLLERDPTAHTDIDASRIEKLPIEAQAGLNQVITLASPGVVSDSNGFFHPIGDHAQTQFSIDNQPVTDQQSRIYSNQISPDAVQSMELITGVAPAEYGDKSSLVVHIVTKSGLDQPKPTGSVSLGYGSFKTPSGDVNIGGGSHTVGDFASLTGLRTDRYLDPPELQALHDTGNNTSFFNRFDVHPNGVDSFHLNVHAARSSFDVPNTFETSDQSQHQDINTINIAPGYSRVIGSSTLLTANGFVRRDHLTYTPSANIFADTPATVSQDRTLTNYGAKMDVAYASGAHNVKVGWTLSATKLSEHFTLGITDPTDQTFAGQNGTFDQDTFGPYDLTRKGGAPFVFDGTATIKQQAAYVQDEIKAGNATFKLGLRLDHYDGLTTDTLLQPRLGVSFAVPGTNTILRASYGRTMETPYNENLLLSSGFGSSAAIVGSTNPPPPGRRNQGEIGVQQAFGNWLVADFGYFNKHTDNAYDFNVLFNTPIVFPVAWDHSRIDGFTGRVDLVQHGGFSAFVVMAHTNAIYFPPGVGGVLLSPPCDQPGCSFRIDHDQKFNATTNVQYVFEKNSGAWAALAWRYDSGLVASSIGDVNDLLALTPDQQAAAGVSCGGVAATLDAGITNCAPGSIAASRLVVPAAGAGDPLTNPTRVAPRHLLDLGLGVDNLLRGSTAKVRLRFSIINLTNREALYNFLSSFSGTHFVTPRAYQVSVGVNF
jgi:carboxypeptidase family protein